MKQFLAITVFILGCIGLSRYLPFLDSGMYNFTPLLATAVILPSITSNKGWLLAPTLIYLITGLTMSNFNLESALMPMLVISLSPYIAKLFGNAFAGGLASWLVWHVTVNFGLMYPPFSAEALTFDLRLLGSTMLYIALYTAVHQGFKKIQEIKHNVI
jgi:hypothetical protein